MTAKAVFADTFYRVALTNPADSRFRAVNTFDQSLSGTGIVRTDEVLTEFLTFFASDAWLRARAALIDPSGAIAQAECPRHSPES